MKFAILEPSNNLYWKEEGAMRPNWKQAKTFLTREDAEAYLKWIKTNYNYSHNYQDLIVVQVE